MSETRNSPSFLIAVFLVIAAVVGFVGWQFLKPNPIGQSDVVVRRLSAAIAEQMGPFRAAVREIQRSDRDTPEMRQAARDRIDELARAVNDQIEDLSDAAITEIESISGIGLRTQENRLSRIRRLSLEGRARVGQLVGEAKSALSEEAN